MTINIKKSASYAGQAVKFKQIGSGMTRIIAAPAAPSPNWIYDIDPDASSGEGAASITNPSPNVYVVTGPSNSNSNGWAYIKAQFPKTTNVTIQYSWSTTDVLQWDWPFYAIQPNEPVSDIGTGTNGYNFGSSPGNIVSNSPESGTLSPVTVFAGQWMAIGVYSVDSNFGPGTITLTLSYS